MMYLSKENVLIRKTIKENTKILNMFKGMINAYGVLSIKDVLNLFKRYGIDILESKLMALISRLINVPSMVYYVIDEKNDMFFLNYEIQSYEAIRNDMDKDLDYAFIEEKTLIIMGEEDYFDKTKFGEKFNKSNLIYHKIKQEVLEF